MQRSATLSASCAARHVLSAAGLLLASAICAVHPPLAAAGGRSGATVIVPLNLPAGASPTETVAAEELAQHLSRLYRHMSFPVRLAGGIHPGEVHLGTLQSVPEWGKHLDADQLKTPESFVVTTIDVAGAPTAIIAGADAAGVMQGVCALLERLGFGFYLSEEVAPPVSDQPFSFAGWQLADAPLAGRRIVFNWHNFLSGCTAWDLPQWQRWIVQSQKMRFNTILVHAYGNSPLAGFSFRGVTKEVGFLATTARGRDWGTAHVNDVRRLRGGSVFDQPVFGAEAAQVPDEQRANAAQVLMQSVFRFAAARGMGVWFALDIDTMAAQPQEIIERLPPSARFGINVAKTNSVQGAVAGQLWLANPETADGSSYYKAQAEALLTLYPQISGLALWIRIAGSPWLQMTPEQLPQVWQKEYAAEIARTPQVAGLGQAPGRFALGKVVAAYQRALRELGRADVLLAVGSWAFAWLEPSHRFFPKGVTFLPLDYEVGSDRSEFVDPERRARTRRIAQERPVIPIAWAHHDDVHYIGRSYTPFADFQDKLTDMGAAGFGIIHWTTRPLDLYFKNLAQQVWSSSKNEPVEKTCRQLADHYFPGEVSGLFGDYLLQWITTAPIFGSAGLGQFVVRPLPASQVDAVLDGCRKRLAMLDRAASLTMSAEGRRQLDYFRDMERFSALYFQSEWVLQSSAELFLKHDYAAAELAIARSRVEEAIELYAQAASRGGITRGEQGVLVGLNLGWLPYHENQRQALGLSAARYDFGVTQFETLAQNAGTISYTVDAQRRLWRKMGARETHAREFDFGQDCEVEMVAGGETASAELCHDGIEIDRPLTLKLGPILFDAKSPFRSSPPIARAMMPGNYRIRLLILDRPGNHGGETHFNVDVGQNGEFGAQTASVLQPPIRMPARASGRLRVAEVSRIAHLDSASEIQIAIRPVSGTIWLCALIIERDSEPRE